MMISCNIYELYVFEFLMGTTFAGRIIVGMNYINEFQLQKYQEDILFYIVFAINIAVLMMTIWYQFIDRGWFWQNLVLLVITSTSLLYFVIFVPESPKW